MDLTSKEARKILRDYYTWYWDNYYESRWDGMSGPFARLLGIDPSMNMHDAMNKAFTVHWKPMGCIAWKPMWR